MCSLNDYIETKQPRFGKKYQWWKQIRILPIFNDENHSIQKLSRFTENTIGLWRLRVRGFLNKVWIWIVDLGPEFSEQLNIVYNCENAVFGYNKRTSDLIVPERMSIKDLHGFSSAMESILNSLLLVLDAREY